MLLLKKNNYLFYGYIFLAGVLFTLFNIQNIIIYGQSENSNSFDKAKSSSDEALSIIDSLKGSSFLNSMMGEMQNFSVPISNNSNSISNNEQKLFNNYTMSTNMQDKNLNNTSLTKSDGSATNNLTETTNNLQSALTSMQSVHILPYPMSILAGDYVPLFSSSPSKIISGNILTKLPCTAEKPELQIIGTSSDGNVLPITLHTLNNFSLPGSGMCMYQSLIPDDLSNVLYSKTMTSIYLKNPSNFTIEVPSTTSIFIGIHKIAG